METNVRMNREPLMDTLCLPKGETASDAVHEGQVLDRSSCGFIGRSKIRSTQFAIVRAAHVLTRTAVGTAIVVAAAILAAGCSDDKGPSVAADPSVEEEAPPSPDANPSPQPDGSDSTEHGDAGANAGLRSAPFDPAMIERTPWSVADERGELVADLWEAIYMQESKVGVARTTVRRVPRDGETLVETVNDTRLALARGGQVGTQRMLIRCVQDASGSLRELSTQIDAGAESNVTRGRAAGDQLHLETTTTGKTIASSLPWQADWPGYFAVAQSMERTPLRAGERRTVKELQPGYNLLVDVTLRAIDIEETAMIAGMARLLRIESTATLAGTPIHTVMWTDESGRIQKTAIPGLQQTSYRVTRDEALAPGDGRSFDILEASIAPLDRPLVQPLRARRAVYRATLTERNPAEAFARDRRQEVDPIDSRRALVTIESTAAAAFFDSSRKIEELAIADESNGAADRPTRADVEPNNLVQSDDPQVVELARSVAAEETNAARLAAALEQHIHRSIRAKNFTQAFATAADVARTLEGDCTEHAVLLAAVLRARRIPARVAIGLVYAEIGGRPGFAYHMWTEAWIGERWLPLDATIGKGTIGVGHIRLTSSNLQGASGYTAFLPVFSVMGRLQFELVEADATTAN